MLDGSGFPPPPPRGGTVYDYVSAVTYSDQDTGGDLPAKRCLFGEKDLGRAARKRFEHRTPSIMFESPRPGVSGAVVVVRRILVAGLRNIRPPGLGHGSIIPADC